MTIAALRRLLDQELPHVPRHPAPRLPHRHWTAKDPTDMTTTPTPAPTPNPPATDTDTEQVSVEQLLAWGDHHDDPDIRDQAARGRAILTGLHRRHTADAELAAITSEREQLEARLAELTARESELAPPKAKARRSSPSYDAATVRAWARANDVDCPGRGRIPKPVLDAWRAATQTGQP